MSCKKLLSALDHPSYLSLARLNLTPRHDRIEFFRFYTKTVNFFFFVCNSINLDLFESEKLKSITQLKGFCGQKIAILQKYKAIVWRLERCARHENNRKKFLRKFFAMIGGEFMKD